MLKDVIFFEPHHLNKVTFPFLKASAPVIHFTFK